MPIACESPDCTNTAVVHITEIEGGTKSVAHLCESCAETREPTFCRPYSPGPSSAELLEFPATVPIMAAREVVVDIEDELVCVVFRADASEYLLLRRAYERGAQQDVELGRAAIYVERNEQSQSAYGGICCAALDPDKFLVEFDDKTAEVTGGEKWLEVRFDLDATRFAELGDAMNHVFQGRMGS